MANVTKSTLATKGLGILGVVASGETASAAEFNDALSVVTSVFGMLDGKTMTIPVTAGAAAKDDTFDEKYLLPLRDICAFYAAPMFQMQNVYGPLMGAGMVDIARLLETPLERTDDDPAVEATYY